MTRLVLALALPLAAGAQRPARVQAQHLEPHASQSHGRQIAKPLPGKSLARAQHPEGSPQSHKAHSDLRVPTHKAAAVRLPALRARVAVTPSRPENRVVAAGAGGEVLPADAVAVPRAAPPPGAVRPWLLLPLGAAGVAVTLGGRDHAGAPEVGPPAPVAPGAPAPITTTPEPAPLAYELVALLLGAGWLSYRRRMHQ